MGLHGKSCVWYTCRLSRSHHLQLFPFPNLYLRYYVVNSTTYNNFNIKLALTLNRPSTNTNFTVVMFLFSTAPMVATDWINCGPYPLFGRSQPYIYFQSGLPQSSNADIDAQPLLADCIARGELLPDDSIILARYETNFGYGEAQYTVNGFGAGGQSVPSLVSTFA